MPRAIWGELFDLAETSRPDQAIQAFRRRQAERYGNRLLAHGACDLADDYSSGQCQTLT
jgi:hypothetical protein